MNKQLRSGIVVLFVLASIAIASPASASEAEECGTVGQLVSTDVDLLAFYSESQQDSECEKDDDAATEDASCATIGPLASQTGPVASFGLASDSSVSVTFAPACLNVGLVQAEAISLQGDDTDRVCKAALDAKGAKPCYRQD